MSPQKLADLHAFLASSDLAVLGSVSTEGDPQGAVLAYAVTPGLELIFDTVSMSRKYGNLIAHPRCSLTIWEGEVTVQYQGVAEVATGAALEPYFSRFPDARYRLSWPGITHFVVKPKWVRWSDFSERPPQIDEHLF